MKIALIACCKKKKESQCRACEMYQSTLFKLSYKYAEKTGCDEIYILSAKYGLLDKDKIIAPYDETLNKKK